MPSGTRPSQSPRRTAEPHTARLAPFRVFGRKVQPAAVLALLPLGFALLALRRIDTLAHPQIFAEDGPVFLQDAYLRSWPESLFRPSAGYLHLLPRVWAELTTLLPVQRLPLSYALFALGTTVVCFAPVLSRRLRWLIPSDELRIASFFVLIVAPGRNEITGTLTYAIWPMGIALVLVSLWGPPSPGVGRSAEAGAVVALGLSGATSIMVWPAFWLRWRSEPTPRNALIAVLATGTGAAQGLIVLLTDHRAPESLGTFADMAMATLVRIWGTMTIGERLLHGVLHERPIPAFVWALAGVGLVVTVLLLFVVPRRFVAPAVITFVLTCLGSFWVLGEQMVLVARSTAAGRYFVIQIVLITLLLMASLSRVRRLGQVSAVTVVAPVMVLLAFASAQDFVLPPPARVEWGPIAACIAAEQRCLVTVNGADFFLPPVPNVRS